MGARCRRAELVEHFGWLAGSRDRRDPTQRMEGAAALRVDLRVDERADAQLVKDLPYLLHAFARERRWWREQRGEAPAGLALGTLEPDHDGKRLLALGEVVHLHLPGSLGRGPDPEHVVVRLEGLAERVAEARERLTDLRIVG